MRWTLARGFLLVVTLAAAGGLAADQASPAPAGQPAVEQTTQAEGTVPDLSGRWLVVAEVTVPGTGGVVVPAPQLWDVRVADGATTLDLRIVQLPQRLLDAVAAANARHQAWEAGAADLERLRGEWRTLAPDDRGLASIETVLLGPEAYPAELKADATMRDSRFIIQQTLIYRPTPGRPIREAMLHGVMETAPWGYRGNYSSVSIAAAPFPVTISFSGTFRMYRLESVPAPGVFARLLDAFAGCGRRPR